MDFAVQSDQQVKVRKYENQVKYYDPAKDIN